MIPLHRLPPKPVDAPALDRSAARALKALDPDLVVFFSRHHIMPNCTVAIDDQGKPGFWPRWHVALWSDRDNRFYRILTLNTPEMDYHPFDHRIVNALRADVVRVKGMKEAINHRAYLRELEREAAKKEMNDSRQDWISDNKQQIKRVLDNPSDKISLARDGKIYGFGGQTKRGSSGTVEKSERELGYNNESITKGVR